jgi:hypothetical protein
MHQTSQVKLFISSAAADQVKNLQHRIDKMRHFPAVKALVR